MILSKILLEVFLHNKKTFFTFNYDSSGTIYPMPIETEKKMQRTRDLKI